MLFSPCLKISSSKTIDLVVAPIPRAKGTRKNVDGRRAYIGWKHAIYVLGNNKKVRCKYYSKTVSGGIFRFKRHLASNRDDVWPCAFMPEDVRYWFMKIVVESDHLASEKR